MNFSDLTEIITESELRKRIGGLWPANSTPADHRYTESGFYPVSYSELGKYQKHNPDSTYLENGYVIIPVTDIDFAEAAAAALSEIDNLRATAEEDGVPFEKDGKHYTFATSFNSQLKTYIASAKNNKTRKWVSKHGRGMMLTTDDIETISAAVEAFVERIYDLQYDYSVLVENATTVEELRNIVAQAEVAIV